MIPTGATPEKPASHRAKHALLDAVLILGVLALAVYGVVRGAVQLDYNWQWYRIPEFFFKEVDGELVRGTLVRGLQLTLELTFYASLASIAGGLMIALLSRAKLASARLASAAYVELMRNTPLLVQLYILYFMMANVLGLEQLQAGILSLALYESAFAAEIFRSGFNSVPAGQYDAARSLGFPRTFVYRLVVLPQMLPLILPPLTNLFVNLFKHSSIVTVIALGDLTDAARNAIYETFLVFEIWLAVAAIYIVISSAASLLIRKWETRIKRRLSCAG